MFSYYKMCDCKIKLAILLQKHMTCREFTFLSVDKIDNNNDVIPDVISDVIPVVDQVMKDFVKEVDEFFNEDCKEDVIMIDEQSEEDEGVELTDISPEELKEQEEEEKKIRDELALIELTRLTKKKVRKSKK